MKTTAVVAAGLVALTCGGCASPGEHYYSLVPGPVAAVPVAAAPTRILVVEPAIVPEAQDRPQLVVGVAPGQIRVLEQERWIQPLPEDLQRALAQALAAALPDVGIRLAGDHAIAAGAWRLYVQVRRFDLSMEQGARLDAHWSILGPDRATLREGDFTRVVAASGARGYAALVQAQSVAAGELAAQLGAAISALRAP